MSAPINVFLNQPTINIPTWSQEQTKWETLNRDIRGNPDFHPLTVKFGYVVGLIYGICECVTVLLEEDKFARLTGYIPAYGLFASAVELLGRCIKGEHRDYRPVPFAGFKWLSNSTYPGYEHTSKHTVLIKTSQREYTIEELDIYIR